MLLSIRAQLNNIGILKQCITNGENTYEDYKKDGLIDYNQMKRIKNGEETGLSATKMTLMHLVTGQEYNHEMVKNTLDLCQLLFDATDLKLIEN